MTLFQKTSFNNSFGYWKLDKKDLRQKADILKILMFTSLSF